MVFNRRDSAPEPSYNMAVLMNKSGTSGQVGLEVEVEGNKFQKESGLPKAWKYTHDGSLRGRDNAEYVLKKPIKFSEVPDAVSELWQMFGDYGSKLDVSNRTSVHVHLNFQQFYLNRLAAFLTIYYPLEEVLTEWCGEHRVGNLFCLRAKDAPALIQQLREFIKSNGRSKFNENIHHYAGLNCGALQKYGSVESRTLRGATEPQLILDWVSILERIYDLSAEYHDPREICEAFSANGPLNFFSFLLGDKTDLVRAGVNMNDNAIRESMYDGIRLAQDIAYCRDWDKFNPIDVKPDPFGRDIKKVMSPQQSQGISIGESAYATASQPAPSAANPFIAFGTQHPDEFTLPDVEAFYDDEED